jgi:ComF family protein
MKFGLGATATRFLLDALLPPRCIGCGALVRDPGALCAGCWTGLSFLAEPLCGRCGVPFEYAVAEESLCGRCLAEPPAYGRARAAVVYDEASRPLVLRFKHGDELHAAPLYATWLARAGASLLAEADLLVPVPLHRWRLLARRYNQSAVLATAVARISGRPVAVDALLRVRRTPSQGTLGRAARERNVAGAFRVRPGAADRVKGRRILLIDDVLTSWATVNACTRALRRSGAAAVDVLTVARVK